MPKKVLQAHYFPDDKDIFDLLSGARQRLTSQKLVDFARGRGLILSASDDRDVLIEQLALLPLSWLELKKLIEATDSADRADRTASLSLRGTFTLDQVIAVADKVKVTRQARGETISYERTAKSLRVKVAYSEMEPNSTRLLQRTRREFTLQFEPRTGSMVVRHQAQPRAGEMLAEIASALSSTSPTRIELSGVRSLAQRTAFFLKLIKAVEGFTFADVKAIKASRLPPEGPEEEESDEPVQADPEDAEDADAIDAEQATFVAYVKDLVLSGKAIHLTEQYKNLQKHGLFVRAMTWTATEQKPKAGGALYEFEAGFENANATGFTYTPRAVFERKADGDLKKTKGAISPDDKTRLLRLLETAATAALDELLAEMETPEAAPTAADPAPKEVAE